MFLPAGPVRAPALRASSQDPCGLVSRAEAAVLLGSDELLMVPDSATYERGRGDHKFMNCAYGAEKLGLEVKWRAYSSATVAQDNMTEKSVPYLLPGADAVAAAPGIGERAYWVTGKGFDGNAFAAYCVLSGRHLITLSLAGEGFTNSSAQRAALRKVTETALRRL